MNVMLLEVIAASHILFFYHQYIVLGIFLGVKIGRRVGLTTLPTSNPMGLHGLYRDNFTFTISIPTDTNF
jgi:hypothetical protein